MPPAKRLAPCVAAAIAVIALSSNAALAADAWKSLFDGKTLAGWKVIDKYDFAQHGKVQAKDGTIVLGAGKPGTAIRYSGKFPKVDYEVELEAMRVEGEDFFGSLVFHVDKRPLALIVGGWSGEIVGLSCIDDEPAVENETCQFIEFAKQKWYKIRLRVTAEKVEAWIDKKQVVDFDTANKKLTVYFEQEELLPFGVTTWRTTGAVRNVRYRMLKESK